MYISQQPRRSAFARLSLLVACAGLVLPPLPSGAEGIIRSAGVIQKISSDSERLELTVNTSRILTLETKIPRVQVNNRELLAVTPLSATQIQVSAIKAGVTQINLWDEKGNVYSVDVIIYGDVRELEHALKIQFPNSNIRVFRYSNALILKGVVDRADHVSPIMRLSEDYSPKVINNMIVAGAGKIMLNVKVMEVSRTKLRRLGFDFAQISSSGGFAGSAISGLLASISRGETGGLSVATSGGETFSFGVVNGNNAFFGFLDALEQNNLLKILAEPVLVTVSGRPAQFNVGGEIPILVPQSLGTVSIEYKKYGTQVDFLPIVLGNGNIRLEIRPRVSELDPTRGVVINDLSIPGFRVREIDTAVEMKAGQTVALAGLIQERTESQSRGFPILGDIPWFGIPFRRMEETINEIELLIVVTPEYIDSMDACEVPGSVPGTSSCAPSDYDFYFNGHLEMSQCDPKQGRPCPYGNQCGPVCEPPAGAVVDAAGMETIQGPMIESPSSSPEVVPPGVRTPIKLPPAVEGSVSPPTAMGPRPYNPNRRPTYVRNRVPVSSKPANTSIPRTSDSPEPDLGLIGPIGYDVQPNKSR